METPILFAFLAGIGSAWLLSLLVLLLIFKD